MKCVVRKLKATIDNASLPIFENVVIKNYITTTQAGQAIHLSDIASLRKNTQMEVLYETTDLIGEMCVISSYGSAYIIQNSGYCVPYNTNRGEYNSVSANTEIRAGFDTSDGSWFVGETTGVCTTPSADEYIGRHCAVFGKAPNYDGSIAGKIKIKRVKITTHQTDSDTGKEYTLVPAEVNGVAVLYDADRGVYYGERNGGTLLCG